MVSSHHQEHRTGRKVRDVLGELNQATEALSADDADTLRDIERRLLWLSTSMVHHANRVRPNESGIKVGGHQASSASMVTIMTCLWFRHLNGNDRVSVKPHASPVLHSVNYLLGDLDVGYMESLRAFGGLQSYPSRTKDPDPVDYSTGSVGIGATATVWGALARRFVDARFGGAGTGRQYALVGDAELDEGAIWEAVLDPAVRSLGELVWIIDLNRQSLDRVVPGIAIDTLQGMFASAGWQVLTVKYGEILEGLLNRPGGEALRTRLDDMTNPEYQRLLRCKAEELRDRLCTDDALRLFLANVDDDTISRAIRNLGGHDFAALDAAFLSIDDTRPTVVFAYTVKGHGLDLQGHPQNHSAMLTLEQYAALGERSGMSTQSPWQRFEEGSASAELCRDVALRLAHPTPQQATVSPIPADLGFTPTGTASTQAALGRTLVELTRVAPAVAARVVTVSPDVSSSTNLGGWINKVGVWSIEEQQDWFDDDGDTILHWRAKPTGQHLQLGIAETNLVGLLGELGATWSRWGEPLLPIGVVYDPFVARALEPWSFGIYAGGQSILVGTPSGVTLAPEGGAHQSITTPSIGLEQPGCVAFEPAFVLDLQWILLDCLSRLGNEHGSSAYLRLSTRPIDQSIVEIPSDPAARERRRAQVVAGGYRIAARGIPRVTIAAMGALLPEALAAAQRLEALDILADVVCVTSADLLSRAVRGRTGRSTDPSWILDQIFPSERATPLVTVLDGHPHTLDFLANIDRVPHIGLGVTRFGQSGSLADVYRYHEIDTDSIIRAALDLLT